MSFGRNLELVFGVGEKFHGMNKPLESVELSPGEDEIIFSFQDGSKIRFGVVGDCCSKSWIEHLEKPYDLLGATITSIEDSSGVPWDGHECGEESSYTRACGHEHLQVYNTKFETNKGTIVLEYRNDSNGYYGGWLERLG